MSKTFTTVMIDRDTHSRLRELAEKRELTISGFIRQVSEEYERKQKELNLEKKVDVVLNALMTFNNARRLNVRGDYVPIENIDEADGTPIPMIQSMMIQEAIEKDPNVTEVGWYRKNKNGKWEYKQKEFDDWYQNKYIPDLDALDAALEALNHDPSGIIRKTDNTDDWMAETGRVRQELIKYGRKLIAKKESKK